MNLQIHNVDASSKVYATTFNDAVTYYFRNVVVGRASFSRLDERNRETHRERIREKKRRKKKALSDCVPLAATKFPVAMADITDHRSTSFCFFFFSFPFFFSNDDR